MNPPTITMDPGEAQEQLDGYRDALRRRSDTEYAAAAAALETLVEGRALLQLSAAVLAGGFDDKMRPRLAIARADRKQVQFFWRTNETHGTFSTTNMPWQWPQLAERVEFDRLHGLERAGQTFHFCRGYALVPMVPPAVRREAPSPLKHYHVLWEVEQWADKPVIAVPDRDPYLLLRVHGDLFAVVGEWELTEVERMVMQGRASEGGLE